MNPHNIRLHVRILVSFLCLCFVHSVFAQVVGYWKTIDDKLKKQRSILQLTHEHGQYQAYVRKVYYIKGEGPNDRCQHCQGEAKGKKILGLKIMWGLKKQTDSKEQRWQGGTILDPSDGHMYHCEMYLEPNGKVLHVRGYIGLSIFGRTQMWYRMSNKAALAEIKKPLAIATS